MRSSQDRRSEVGAIVWLHGAGMDRTVWMLTARDPRLRHLEHLAVDLPGHGRSRLSGGRTVETYARAVIRQLDERSLSKVRVVGHSMGALVALELLRSAPKRLAAMALAGAAAHMPVNPSLIEAAQNDLPRAAAMIATYAVGPAGRLASPALPGVRLGGGCVALLANSRPGVLAADLAACAAYRSEVGPSPVPALVITGTSDRMVPARHGRELAAALHAELHEIEGAGHMMMLEQPASFADAVAPFLLRVG